MPFAAGGGNDIFARLVGKKLGEILGQQVINENKPGAGGRIAAEYVMNQPDDGYTLFVGASGVMSIAAAVYPKLAYHPTKSFIPLTMIANFPLILVVPPDIRRRPSRSSSPRPRRIPTSRTMPRPRRPSRSRPSCSSSRAACRAGDPLQEQQRDDPVRHPGADSVRDIGRAAGHSADQGRQGPGARRDRLGPFGGTAGRAEHGRGRLPGGEHQAVERLFRRDRNAGADRQEAGGGLRKAITDPDVSAKLKALAVNPGGSSSAEFRAMIDDDITTIAEVIKAAN